MPEVTNNIDTTSGNLGLTDKEEDQIVAFLETLSDGFTRPYPNMDTFTGACMKGGSAATQGNETLIPTPPLPPCPSAICGAEPLPSPKAISDLGGGPVAQTDSSELRAESVRILSGPEIERATQHLTIIRWNTNNLGGSPVHYGVVHYGTRPDRLIATAASPIRLNPDHATTLFRVRIDHLHEGTTYYFKVDSEGADGMSDGVVGEVKSFVIR
jgi:hypothetical protein